MKNVKNNEQNAVQQKPNRKVIDLQNIKCVDGIRMCVYEEVEVHVSIIPTESFLFCCSFDNLNINNLLDKLKEATWAKNNKVYTSAIIKTEAGDLWEFELIGIGLGKDKVKVAYEFTRELPYREVKNNNNNNNKED